MPSDHPVLTALRVNADPAAWRALGLSLDPSGRGAVGGIALEVAAGPGEGGLRAWGWAGLPDGAGLDGIPAFSALAPAAAPDGPFSAVDHVVVGTGDLDRTVAALDAAGLDRRRIRDAGKLRQAFYVAGPALVEVAGPKEATGDPAGLWGVTFVVDDLEGLAARLGERAGEVRDAVQSGRRIMTIKREAGLGVPVACMTPRH